MVAFALLETQALKNHEVGLQITWFLFYFFLMNTFGGFGLFTFFYFNLLKYILKIYFQFLCNQDG